MSYILTTVSVRWPESQAIHLCTQEIGYTLLPVAVPVKYWQAVSKLLSSVSQVLVDVCGKH